MTTDVMIFFEDPGATNFVAELPAVLKFRGHSSQMFVRSTGAWQLVALEASNEDAGAMRDATAPRMACRRHLGKSGLKRVAANQNHS